MREFLEPTKYLVNYKSNDRFYVIESIRYYKNKNEDQVRDFLNKYGFTDIKAELETSYYGELVLCISAKNPETKDSIVFYDGYSIYVDNIQKHIDTYNGKPKSNFKNVIPFENYESKVAQLTVLDSDYICVDKEELYIDVFAPIDFYTCVNYMHAAMLYTGYNSKEVFKFLARSQHIQTIKERAAGKEDSKTFYRFFELTLHTGEVMYVDPMSYVIISMYDGTVNVMGIDEFKNEYVEYNVKNYLSENTIFDFYKTYMTHVLKNNNIVSYTSKKMNMYNLDYHLERGYMAYISSEQDYNYFCKFAKQLCPDVIPHNNLNYKDSFVDKVIIIDERLGDASYQIMSLDEIIDNVRYIPVELFDYDEQFCMMLRNFIVKEHQLRIEQENKKADKFSETSFIDKLSEIMDEPLTVRTLNNPLVNQDFILIQFRDEQDVMTKLLAALKELDEYKIKRYTDILYSDSDNEPYVELYDSIDNITILAKTMYVAINVDDVHNFQFISEDDVEKYFK